MPGIGIQGEANGHGERHGPCGVFGANRLGPLRPALAGSRDFGGMRRRRAQGGRSRTARREGRFGKVSATIAGPVEGGIFTRREHPLRSGRRPLPAVCGGDPEDSASAVAVAGKRGIRSLLIRRDPQLQAGDGSDHAAGGPCPLRHRLGRAADFPGHDRVGLDAPYAAHDLRDRDFVHLSLGRDRAAGADEGGSGHMR